MLPTRVVGYHRSPRVCSLVENGEKQRMTNRNALSQMCTLISDDEDESTLGT